jgi:hypothetical protein
MTTIDRSFFTFELPQSPLFGNPPEREILTAWAINLIYSASEGPFQRAFFRPLPGKTAAPDST